MTAPDAAVSTHTHFFRGEDELRAAVAILADRARQGQTPRAWCAGCSAGPEPYTLAILCAEAGVAAHIHATDFNESALALARAGRYPEIALRTTPQPLVDRHFHRHAADYQIAPALRRAVTFERADLRLDPPPATPVADPGFDVILCRNVLLHYDPEAATTIAHRLAHALRPHGVLIVAQTDPLAFRLTAPLRPATLPGIAAYTRTPTTSPTPPPAPRNAPSPHAVAPPHAAAFASLAAHAWDHAAAELLRAEQANPLAMEPPLYLGLLRRKQGNLDEAASHLRRAAFLAPESWLVSYLLAGVWERLGDRPRAHLELRRTLQNLERAASTPHPPGADTTGIDFDPAEITRICKERLTG